MPSSPLRGPLPLDLTIQGILFPSAEYKVSLPTQGPPTTRPLPAPAQLTHSEAPSLVGDGPSAMAGLMVSAGSTGFLRASIGAPRAGGGGGASNRGP